MAFLPQIGVAIPIYEEGRLYVNLLCTGPGERAIAIDVLDGAVIEFSPKS